MAGTAAIDAGAVVDHYAVLGLSPDAGPNLTPKEIGKVYKRQSLARHPDKRPDDPNAKADFQRLRFSYEVLRDPIARAALDARLLARAEAAARDLLRGEKRRRAVSDLEERERAAAAEEVRRLARESREKQVAEELQREVREIWEQMMFRKSGNPPIYACQMPGKDKSKEKKEPNEDERTIKVSWDKGVGDYSCPRLREVLEKFGIVKDLVMATKKRNRGSAIVVMATKDAALSVVQGLGRRIL